MQFYTEIGESVTDLAKPHNCVDREDEDGVESDRGERESLNNRFRSFFSSIENIFNIGFEEPLRDLAFVGAPGQGRASVLLQPTTSCLINITEWVFHVHFDPINIP